MFKRFGFSETTRRIGTLALAIGLTASAVVAHAQQPKPLLLGVIGTDSATARGVQLAAFRFNARGNTLTPNGTAYQVVVQTADAQTADEVATAIGTLKQAGAVAIFGPEQDALVPASFAALSGAGIPVFTSATNTAVAPSGTVFRTRADATRLLSGLAQYVAGDLTKSKIALFQGSDTEATRVTAFTTEIGKLGKTPATTVLQVAGGAIKDSAGVLLQTQPDAVVAFGTPDQDAQLLRELRSQNYAGLFVNPDADDPAFITAVPDTLRGGIVGVTNWAYSSQVTVSAQFVRDYVALFGSAPTAHSAAAYDAAAATIIAISRSGIAPTAISQGLLALPRVESIQGHYNAALGGNELSADVSVFTTGIYGAPIVTAQFDETGRLALSAAPPTVAGVIATSVAPVTAVPATAVPPTIAPATPIQGAVLSVTAETLNVRSGPGTSYAILGRLKAGDQVQIVGISPDGQWVVINFVQRQGWVLVSASLNTILGNIQSVPVVNPPATPIPPTATVAPYVDLVGVTYVVNPPTVKSGQPFTVSVVIRNQSGLDAGPFAVATSFLPGNVFSAVNLPGLPAGQTTTVNLAATVTGTGTFTVQVILDLNSQVNLGSNRAHAQFPVTYTVAP